MELHEFKYLGLYFGAIYRKFYGANSYTFDQSLGAALEEYLERLQVHE